MEKAAAEQDERADPPQGIVTGGLDADKSARSSNGLVDLFFGKFEHKVIKSNGAEDEDCTHCAEKMHVLDNFNKTRKRETTR